jgi:DNA-binding transcriptional regulator GbsR (MarR family)
LIIADLFLPNAAGWRADLGFVRSVHFRLNILNLLRKTACMLLALAQKEAAKSRSHHQPPAPLNALETEVIDLFVQLSRLLGQPRSLAEIYGLLFISAQPLAMDDLIARLNLSKGSASQGLKYLRNLGAVTMIYVPGDRRVHYEAVAELRNLATRFLRDQFVPHLESGHNRLERITTMVKQLPAADRARVQTRVTMLQSWGKRGKRFLPLVLKIMGSGG